MNDSNGIMVKSFSPQEIAEICNTSVDEITEMIKKGIFGIAQQRAKNKKDIISSVDEIKEIYGISKVKK